MFFYQWIFLLSSILLDGLLYGQIIFHLYGNLLINCALNDPQSNYFPLKFPRPHHFKSYWYNWFQTIPTLCITCWNSLLYLIFQKRSCLHIGIAILRWPLLHLLDICLLISDHVHLCMHVKYPMWLF